MALQEKLIDATGQFEDAVAKARELGKAPNATVVRYRSPFRLTGLLRMLRPPTSLKVELPALSSSLKPGRIYLVPEGFQNY
jgi:protease-4